LKLTTSIILLFLATFGLKAKGSLKVKDVDTKEALISASVMFVNLNPSKQDSNFRKTDAYGSVTVPYDSAIAKVSYLGYDPTELKVYKTKKNVALLKQVSILYSEIVTTGQYSPTLSTNSIIKVDVLDRDFIESKAANNLRDLLLQEGAININQDAQLGSNLSINGLGGENVKILVDGIPVIGRTNGNIDLSQLSLTNIDRVEIVKGPMSTLYGTDALGGVINLISSKDNEDEFSANARGMYESVGRYNLDVGVNGSMGDGYASLNLGRHFFGGFASTNNSRSKLWKPKEQYFVDLDVKTTYDGTDIRYKGNYFDELLISKGQPIAPYFEGAYDNKYSTNRFNNAIFISKQLQNNKNYSLSFSLSDYTRSRNTFFKDLVTLDEVLTGDDSEQDTTRFNSINIRAAFFDEFLNDNLGYNVGIDFNLDNGSGGRIEGTPVINDYAAYISVKYIIDEIVTIQPALRAIYNTKYDAPLVPALNLMSDLTDELTVRASYAKGFRAPSLKELYFFFVDASHNIQGNQDLNAESSDAFNFGFAYTLVNNKRVLKFEPNFYYNAIENKINLANVQGDLFTYINIGQHRTIGTNTTLKYIYDDFYNKIGFNYIGTENFIDGVSNGVQYTPEVTFNSSWDSDLWDLKFSIFYKFTGESPGFVLNDEEEIENFTIDSYHNMDASIMRKFDDLGLSFSLGVINVFNVTTVNSNQIQQGGAGHSGGSAALPVGYGRTVFAKFELDI
jgi:outer membrane receptor for ferrienterochelin and colicins